MNDNSKFVITPEGERFLAAQERGQATLDETDEILQELGATENEWADGASLYGPGGLYDNLRKSFLCARGLEIRDSMAGVKFTEALVDQRAHADPEYVTFLDKHLIDRANWLALDAVRQRHWMRLKGIHARQYDMRRFGA